MLFFKQPDSEQIAAFIAAQSRLNFTYPQIGSTRTQSPPAGYRVDNNRICLGPGRECYESAKQALIDWQHYHFDWLTLHRPDAVPEAGQAVAALAHVLGIWVLNACRVVYVVEETEPLCRFGFAYGTLPEHAESGEERFQIEWNTEDDSVWYDLYAFSRPGQLLSKIASPYVRRKQKQFARESLLAMRDAVLKNDR